MGTADEIVKSPEKGTVFVEDLPEEEQVVAVVSYSYTRPSWWTAKYLCLEFL